MGGGGGGERGGGGAVMEDEDSDFEVGKKERGGQYVNRQRGREDGLHLFIELAGCIIIAFWRMHLYQSSVCLKSYTQSTTSFCTVKLRLMNVSESL